ncbi:GD24498 [Drosophila simulans]|uniref:GD24498 n=1 Tax=Drosophila simulans TaxID=7240 RepID=B4NUH4_DROSI|nr:GD24498 [Drosophila simulans]
MKQLAILLNDFNFECIGTAQTDDENVICESLKRFGAIIGNIEDEREKMLTLADKHIIESLEDFRKKQIGGVKENKKKFDKKTEKFCQSQERFLNMSTKKPENTIQEADASLGMHEREYIQESLSYVLRIQEVQERIKFEFVEILLAFISGWLVFYHTAHEQGGGSSRLSAGFEAQSAKKARGNFYKTRLPISNGENRVRTLYACMGESEGELSFEPNQIITNGEFGEQRVQDSLLTMISPLTVRYSHEPGWLQGTLNGKTGLIPENYVEHLKPHH